MKISIITANYNYEKYLENAIKSVMAQTYTDWELIIVDDGSSDNSVEIIKKYCTIDSRIKYFEHQNHENKGLKESILLGLQNCSGDWVAFLESDDAFSPDYLEEKIKIANSNPEVNLIFNNVEFLCEEKSKKLQNKIKFFDKIQNKLAKNSYPKNMEEDFFFHNQILTFSCAMVKSEDLRRVNFEAPIDSQLDWWLWSHIATFGKFYYLNKPLTIWRQHEKSYTLRKKTNIFVLTSIWAYYDIHKTEKRRFKLLWLLDLTTFAVFIKIVKFFEKLILNF